MGAVLSYDSLAVGRSNIYVFVNNKASDFYLTNKSNFIIANPGDTITFDMNPAIAISTDMQEVHEESVKGWIAQERGVFTFSYDGELVQAVVLQHEKDVSQY